MAAFNGYFHILTEWYVNFLKEIVHVEKLWDTFDKLSPIKNYDIGESYVYKVGNLTLKNLGFSYNNSTEVLSHFSLSIHG
jgi:ribonucleotide reductase beta subunit family protein with ferritin-like domain